MNDGGRTATRIQFKEKVPSRCQERQASRSSSSSSVLEWVRLCALYSNPGIEEEYQQQRNNRFTSRFVELPPSIMPNHCCCRCRHVLVAHAAPSKDTFPHRELTMCPANNIISIVVVVLIVVALLSSTSCPVFAEVSKTRRRVR